MKAELKDAKFISIISDGSTDVSVKENEAVYIRFCVKGVPKVSFISMETTGKADANGILGAIKKALAHVDDDKMIEKKVVAFAADGASVNSGQVNGVIAKMREEWSPSIMMITCLAHRLELCF